MLAAEAVVTFVLVLVVVAVATDSRVPRGIAAMAIGAALAVAIVISGPVSGAGYVACHRTRRARGALL